MTFRMIACGVIGFSLGGPLGAILAVLFLLWLDGSTHQRRGHHKRHSRSRPEHLNQVQEAFLKATFRVMGRLAKADGRVSEREIELAQTVMTDLHLSEEHRRQAVHFFRQGKHTHSIEEALWDFRACQPSRDLIQMFLEIQLRAGYADGAISSAEFAVLQEAAACLGLQSSQLNRLHAQFASRAQFDSRFGGRGQQQNPAGRPARDELRRACATLGITESAPFSAIKKAYRKQMSENHPDKLIAKGLPQEMMEVAKRKTQEIQAAYDLLRSAHKQASG